MNYSKWHIYSAHWLISFEASMYYDLGELMPPAVGEVGSIADAPGSAWLLKTLSLHEEADDAGITRYFRASFEIV